MKLLRYGGVGAEKPGILGGPGIIRDLSGHVADIDGITSAEERARQVALTPLSRAATPHECVGAYLFLACDQLSSFITGQSLEVNGGWVMP